MKDEKAKKCYAMDLSEDAPHPRDVLLALQRVT